MATYHRILLYRRATSMGSILALFYCDHLVMLLALYSRYFISVSIMEFYYISMLYQW